MSRRFQFSLGVLFWLVLVLAVNIAVWRGLLTSMPKATYPASTLPYWQQIHGAP
jgi:hypothetical protein